MPERDTPMTQIVGREGRHACGGARLADGGPQPVATDVYEHAGVGHAVVAGT